MIMTMMLGCMAMYAAAQDAKAPTDTAAVKDSLPYQKYPKLPAFNIMLTDSSTVFNTFNIPSGKPIAIMLFDPQCVHCKALTRAILKDMHKISDIQFYMVTPAHSWADIIKFYDDFKLAEYTNIKVIGRDYEFFFHEYFGVKFIPDIALYNKDKMLIKLFEGDKVTVKDLRDATK